MKDSDISTMLYRVCLLKDDDYTAVGVDVAVGLVAPVTWNQNTWRNLKSR